MRIGYARVSTGDQTTQPQADALGAAGCERIVTETVSGAAASRPVLDRLLSKLASGDVLVVVRLDRMGRSLPHLIEVVRQLEVKEAGLVSLSEAIDTTTAGGRLIFHMMGALAEFERALIVERTQAGLKAARKRGVKVGRPMKLTAAAVRQARTLIDAGEAPSAVARSLGVGRSTLYRAFKARPG